MAPRASPRRPRASSALTLKSAVTLWLVLWLMAGRFCVALSCPKFCVCYDAPMTVSCQSQNFSSVPSGVPYDSQRVFLQNNRITELRADSFGFETQVLWLYSNNLSWIEGGAFSSLRVLEELDLGDNPSLRRLDGAAFRGLERLQSLHMHRCGLTELPADLFLKLYSLQFLYLQENQLTMIPDGLFSDLVNLTHLFLHGNRIRTISENAFRGLVNLDRLLLHGNRIRQVHRRAFRDLGRLTILYLFDNELRELQGQVLRDTSNVQFLRLNGNPWSCSCEGRSLWEFFRGTRVSSSEVTCETPTSRKGQDLRFLREMDFALCPLPDPGTITGTTTTTFSTKTRWRFHKGKHTAARSFHKGGDSEKGFPLKNLHPAVASASNLASNLASKYEMAPEEAALPKLEPEEFWANYGNEEPASVHCLEPECQASDLASDLYPSSSSSVSPSFLSALCLSVLTLSLHLLFG
ncbi:reticulon-4 receptor-like 2b [Hoplias malabaricus]|uniref:reticulon-4 receptor-like 2b n=1 Tax=Hoplias malabaricus TaxID=27720 RepID=UPI0034617C30